MERTASRAVGPVRTGVGVSENAAQAVAELHSQIAREDAALNVFFASSKLDRKALGEAIRERFGSQPVIGCTTAGEIGPEGYRNGSITGFSFSSHEFRVETVALSDLSQVPMADGQKATVELRRCMAEKGPAPTPQDTFAFLLIDGLSRSEETIVNGLNRGLDGIPLFGGSAADDAKFEQTWVWVNGEFRSNHALLALVQTSLPFHVFKTQHFASSDTKLVVTGADPANRRVFEINGAPAAEEYAKIVGIDAKDLSSDVFAAHPVVVKVGGVQYVRSIMTIDGDRSLLFACAIDEGVVMSVAQGENMLDNLQETFAGVRQRIGDPALVIGCDCLFREVEMDQRKLRQSISEVMRANNVVGFATYGEQYNGMHVNQTFTGVAIGNPR